MQTTQSALIHAYIMTNDSGFAPNPYHGFCTLANCKPQIRERANVGDWVVGLAGKGIRRGAGKDAEKSHVVYAMQVDEVVTHAEYGSRAAFKEKRPHPKNPECAAGDAIYYMNRRGGYVQRSNPNHGSSHMDRDVRSSDRVLISRNFVYFGHLLPVLPDAVGRVRFEGIGGIGPGIPDDDRYAFFTWLESTVNEHGGWGQLGEPNTPYVHTSEKHWSGDRRCGTCD